MTTERDEVLDDLRQALAVEPSPAFQARVRVAISVNGTRAARHAWVGAGVALALAAAVAVLPTLLPQTRLRSLPDVPMKPSRESQVQALTPAHASVVLESSRPPGRSIAAQRVQRSVGAQVLVPPGQLRLLMAYAVATSASEQPAYPDHVPAPVVELAAPAALEPVVVDVVAAPIVDVIKG